MKKDKINKVILLFIILLMVCLLAFGYMLLSGKEIFINGTANASPSNVDFKVGFDSSVTPTMTGCMTAASITSEKCYFECCFRF